MHMHMHMHMCMCMLWQRCLEWTAACGVHSRSDCSGRSMSCKIVFLCPDL